MHRKSQAELDEVIQRCLVAFVQAGTLALSLDQIAIELGVSKRMLVHYFGGREAVEERAMSLLEDQLRAQFAPSNFSAGASLATVVTELWERTTEPASRGVLLLIMDVSRRAWNGSPRAKAFYEEQQRLGVELLLHFSSDRVRVEEILQLFQGAVLTFLITGDAERGRLALHRLASG